MPKQSQHRPDTSPALERFLRSTIPPAVITAMLVVASLLLIIGALVLPGVGRIALLAHLLAGIAFLLFGLAALLGTVILACFVWVNRSRDQRPR